MAGRVANLERERFDSASQLTVYPVTHRLTYVKRADNENAFAVERHILELGDCLFQQGT